MIVDLLLLLVSIVVFLYDFLTFPIYWLVQQPWKKRWEQLSMSMSVAAMLACASRGHVMAEEPKTSDSESTQVLPC